MGFWGRSIIVYGTGINAGRFIEEHHGKCNIICCIDKTKMSGECNGIPIKTWDDIEPGMADCLVVAANPKHVRDIYFRIIFDCERNGLEIYDWMGVDLRRGYLYENIAANTRYLYSGDRKAELIHEIDTHEAISFDLFDTLIMRKVMEPVDVFDLVDRRLPDNCPVKGRFKVIRRSCELKHDSVINGFDGIYEQMGEDTDLTVRELDEIAALELKCERELIIRRNEMVEAFDYAVRSGKQVYIISDMYLGAQFLSGILDELGIKGYKDIYVSCDYRKTKSRGLFEVYKDEVTADSFLHIGDNDEADGDAAVRCGIDSFIVPSGISLMRASAIRKLLIYAKGDLNRRIIGELIADTFSDPFSLCGDRNDIIVRKISTLGSCIVAPIVYLYINKLLETKNKKKYDRVLLGSRDGYIINRIIKEGYKDACESEFTYFYISRILAYKLGMGNPIVDKDYRRYIEADDRRKLEEDTEYIAGREPVPYRKTKEAFEEYLNRCDLSYKGKYLFCDLISGGTVQHSLKVLFENGLDGFYLNRTFSYMERELDYSSVFCREDYPLDQVMVDRLETLLCAPEPSVRDIDNESGFVFEKETRSRDELDLLGRIQDDIVRGVRYTTELADIYETEPEKMLAVTLIQMMDHMRMAGELSLMKEWIHNDINGEQVKVFN